MFLKVLTFLIGMIFTIVGMLSVILYFNLMTIGYSFLEYVNFIIGRYEFWCLPIGLILMFIIIFKGGKREIYL